MSLADRTASTGGQWGFWIPTSVCLATDIAVGSVPLMALELFGVRRTLVGGCRIDGRPLSQCPARPRWYAWGVRMADTFKHASDLIKLWRWLCLGELVYTRFWGYFSDYACMHVLASKRNRELSSDVLVWRFCGNEMQSLSAGRCNCGFARPGHNFGLYQVECRISTALIAQHA